MSDTTPSLIKRPLKILFEATEANLSNLPHPFNLGLAMTPRDEGVERFKFEKLGLAKQLRPIALEEYGSIHRLTKDPSLDSIYHKLCEHHLTMVSALLSAAASNPPTQGFMPPEKGLLTRPESHRAFSDLRAALDTFNNCAEDARDSIAATDTTQRLIGDRSSRMLTPRFVTHNLSMDKALGQLQASSDSLAAVLDEIIEHISTKGSDYRKNQVGRNQFDITCMQQAKEMLNELNAHAKDWKTSIGFPPKEKDGAQRG